MPVRLKKKPKQDLLLETINRFQVEQSTNYFHHAITFEPVHRAKSQSPPSLFLPTLHMQQLTTSISTSFPGYMLPTEKSLRSRQQFSPMDSLRSECGFSEINKINMYDGKKKSSKSTRRLSLYNWKEIAHTSLGSLLIIFRLREIIMWNEWEEGKNQALFSKHGHNSRWKLIESVYECEENHKNLLNAFQGGDGIRLMESGYKKATSVWNRQFMRKLN